MGFYRRLFLRPTGEPGWGARRNDADKKGYPDYLQLSLQLCRPGAIVVADNVVRGGRMADPASTDPDIIGLRKYFDLLAAHPELSSTAMQTVGAKGWDGFSISLVKP
ncbi:hypothetical protein [Paraburkholderia sp. BL10I2N1]|uniref:O-methyltransferase n=1 Tax=Paraburkholderia sp. BL10I2N1 TaxID=1938796 RepID=UPI00105B8801|nr:hypothetical protein [Paraburkholderia sp. BL10I2N1]